MSTDVGPDALNPAGILLGIDSKAKGLPAPAGDTLSLPRHGELCILRRLVFPSEEPFPGYGLHGAPAGGLISDGGVQAKQGREGAARVAEDLGPE